MNNVRFDNFRIRKDSVYDIGDGVIPEIAVAFEHDLTDEPDPENLGELIAKVGPAKTLQDNIELVKSRIGSTKDASGLAIDWIERSGLLTPVSRSFLNPNLPVPGMVDIALVTGGVRNWMQRRANVLIDLDKADYIKRVILAGGNRKMKTVEGTDVIEGMTEADYLEKVVLDKIMRLGRVGLVDMVKVNSESGNDVMARVAKRMGHFTTAAVISNAGAWVQNAGQARRAIMAEHANFDSSGRRIYVVSDGFPIAKNDEPSVAAQNPYSALGQIVRGAHELVQHQ